MKKNSFGVRDETKLFMIKRLLNRGLKLEEIEKELDIKNLFDYMRYNPNAFSDVKFKKESMVI
ncbi:hypothetical protein [Fusobacterium varium]|uniref:hypothetical protein n=1 Tax=Fusobacterium varium TaxID=856 RepID=UPI0022E2EE8E|nr:hypothetical protein [Fusobacterium varium]